MKHFFKLIPLLIFLIVPISLTAMSGDIDNNGVVEEEDARLLTRYLSGEVSAVFDHVDADVTSDGIVDMEDAFAIAKRATGRTKIIVISPKYGSPNNLRIGSTIRIEIFEKFKPYRFQTGVVSIKSESTEYDSGERRMYRSYGSQSLYYHWNTRGLEPASDYIITVTTSDGEETSTIFNSSSLSARIFEPPLLSTVVDATAPCPGIPLVFERVYPHDSANYPYLGPLGRGWVHNYDIFLQEDTDGLISLHGPQGFNRFFTSNDDGTYSSSPGDYGVLSRDVGDRFILTEKSGLIYHFNSNNKIHKIEDLNGNQLSFSYSGDHLTKIEHSCGRSFRLQYGSNGRLLSLTDHVGRKTVYSYYPSRGSIRTNHVLSNVVNPAGDKTRYNYHWGRRGLLNYRLTSIVNPDGTESVYEYDHKARLTRISGKGNSNAVEFSYDSDGTTYTTDAVESVDIVKVNASGKPLWKISPDNNIDEMSYDNNNNLIHTKDPLGRETNYSYDEHGNMTKMTDALNNSFRYAYDENVHKPTRITDPLNRSVKYDYDSHGNQTSITYPDGSQEYFTYNSRGIMLSRQDSMGRISSYTYDNKGQMTSAIDAAGNLTGFSHNSGELESISNAKNIEVVKHTRNVLGRITRSSYPDGSHEDYKYDGNGKMVEFRNRKGQKITYVYNSSGLLLWENYSTNHKYRYSYDSAGYLTNIEKHGLGRELVEDYERDASHRIVKVKVPTGKLSNTYDISYGYDAAGNRSLMVYPDGYLIRYKYDNLNRLARITEEDGTTIVAYQYDAVGKRINRSLGNGTYTHYQYNNMDRITSLTNYSPESTVQSYFNYAYNLAGIRTSMTTLEGTHAYNYDDIYQLTDVQYPGGGITNFTFDEVGNRISVVDDGELTQYRSNTLDQYTEVGPESLKYDKNGNLVQIKSTNNTIKYTWNTADQLVKIKQNGINIDYEYDHEKRMISKTINGQTTRYIWDGVSLVAEMDASGQLLKRYVYGSNIDEIIRVTHNGIDYWCQQDGLGSAVGTTDNDGNVTATASYDVYGTLRTGGLSHVPQRLAGMIWDEDAGLYYVRARWYDPHLGCFISVDPIKNTSNNQYFYADNNPITKIDPLGLKAANVEAVVELIELIRNFIEYLSNTTSLGRKGDSRTVYEPHDTYKPGDYSKPYFGEKWLNEDELNEHNGKFHGWKPDYIWLDSNGNIHNGYYKRFRGLRVIPNTENPNIRNMWDPNPFLTKSPDGSYIVWGYDAGMCPTFIQPPQASKNTTNYKISENVNEPLIGEIIVPLENCLLRSDIPIYGIAAGRDFLNYRVEYGKGERPSKWYIIDKSEKLQTKNDCPDFKDISWMQGDIDLKGNLATWNVGLKNWSHLPWHAPEDDIDLNGVYTIRLVVEGKDGKTIEDRVTGEVGRVIAQCLPGIAVSSDQRVTLRFPEQALTDSFRVYTILPMADINEDVPKPPAKGEFIGPVYRIREPGDRFAKDVIMEFKVTNKELKNAPEHSGICQYDVKSKKWIWLNTAYDKKETTFRTILKKLPEKKAIYALIHHNEVVRSTLATPVNSSAAQIKPVKPGVLVDYTFEENMGSFKSRDRYVGATVKRNNSKTPDGSYCIEIMNENYGGNFSCTVLDQPFDVREYSNLSFDYRIADGVKIDFYFKVNDRWYHLRFTGDPVDYDLQDVNIANLGEIQGVIADDQWHTANVDLRYLLRQQTQLTVIEEVMMANWNVSGYMKLAFGSNARDASLNLDNFKITGPGIVSQIPPILMIENYEESNKNNRPQIPSGSYGPPGTRIVESSIVSIATPEASGAEATSPAVTDKKLLLTFDMSMPDAYGGYWRSLKGTDLSDYNVLKYEMHTMDNKIPDMDIGIRNIHGVEGKTKVSPYALSTGKNRWDVTIPLSGFKGLTDLSHPDVLFFSFKHHDQSVKTNLWIDDIRLIRESYSQVSDFEHSFDWNYLGGEYTTGQNGAAVISASTMPDVSQGIQSNNNVCRISYGGTIGLDYGQQGGFSYCGWNCSLNNYDARAFKFICMKVRGEKGGEKPNIYLRDANKRIPLRAKFFPALTNKWQTIKLPLTFYSNLGIDLSHLEALECVFEWNEQSGTIYVDDIFFE